MSNTSKKRELSERGRWASAIAGLLTCKNHQEAAEAAGVPYSTLRRWLRNEKFVALYRRARRDLVEQTIGGLQRTSAEAVDALRRNLSCGVPGPEIRAALGIIELAVKGIELLDFEERLALVETRLQEGQPDGRPK